MSSSPPPLVSDPNGTSASRTATLDRLFGAWDRCDAPGLVVGIASHGQVLYRRGFGMASVQHGVANTAMTRMRIASTSKHFTALAALLLAEEGLLNLDAPVTRYLPALPAPRGTPTIRQFITHTSGLRCTLDMGTLANGFAPQPSSWQLDAMLRQSDTHFAPQHGQLYCNGTYHVLSLIIERLAGIPFERFLEERIFEPLGMRDTESVANDLLMVPGMASPHVPATEGGWARPASDSELRGDGGIVSTVDDMLRWLAHLRGPKTIGSAESWQQLLEPATLANGLRTSYAMGLKRHAHRGVEVIHHSGGLTGLSCQMLTVPAHELDIVVMVNGAPVSATALARGAMEIVLPNGALDPAPEPARAAEFAHLVGAHYRGPGGLLIAFGNVEGSLGISFMNMTPVPVLYRGRSEVTASFEDIGMGPYRWALRDLLSSTGAPEHLPIDVAGAHETLELLTNDSAGSADVLARLAGRYFSADLRAQAQIEDGDTPTLHLRGDYSGTRTFRMEAISPDTFGLVGIAPPGERYALQAKIVRDGRVEGFWIDTYRARRLWFGTQAG